MVGNDGTRGPNKPGYQAPYHPSDTRDVGTGTDFGADLYALYRAGRVYFPDAGIKFSGWASDVHDFTQRISFLDQSVGGEQALRTVDEIRADLHFALRHTAITMDLVGRALVEISTDFATTDQDAQTEFNRLIRTHPGLLGQPTPDVPEPPGSADPYDEPYTGPSLEAPEPPPWWEDLPFFNGGDQ
jgi:hypothetical protein